MKALSLFAGVVLSPLTPIFGNDSGPNAANYSSIQEAIDKNPGQIVFLPAGDYEVSQAVSLTKDNSGLSGPGRIIGTNVEEAVIEIQKAANVQLHDITIARPEGRTDTLKAGIDAADCPGLVLDGVRVIDNRTRFAAILFNRCDNSQVLNCVVQNYMRITEEDRRQKQGQGYAFMTLGGTGIDLRESAGVLVQGTRIVERNFLPTPELKEKYGLGKITQKNAVKGEFVAQSLWDSGYNNAWHQGSALHLGVPLKANYIRIVGNYIENAAQGIDVQGDHIIIANNIVNTAFIGMKAIHGCRNVIIVGNQFSKNDLWAIQVAPGTLSHAATEAGPDGKPAEANIDAGTIVANNIISDFGMGPAAWMWKGVPRNVIRFEAPEVKGTPPLRDVVIDGNILYDTGRDKILIDGKPQVVPPGYNLAVHVATGEGAPEGLHFTNNIFAPGLDGVSNVELKP